MNYCVSIGEHEYHISVQDNHLVIDGQPDQGRLISLNHNGLHMLRRDLRDVELHLQPQEAGAIEVLIGSQRMVARVETVQCTSRRREDARSGALSAPMPGMVTTILVSEGQTVERGQVLAVLESMKMQMQMRAPMAGCVTCIAVQPGAQVDKGTLLVQIA